MSASIPPAVNYPSPLNAVPTRWNLPPREGNKMIVCAIDWTTMGGADNCINFNLQNNAALEFSQIIALSVDNSQCGGDVRFLFPDTAETVTIPAGSPKTIIEVFTNMTQFYVLGINIQAGDETNFSIHNGLPPPVSVSITRPQDSAVFGAIPGDVGGTTQIVPLGVNGTIEAASVFANIKEAAPNTGDWELVDGTGMVVAGGRVGNNNSQQFNSLVLSLSGLNFRFQNGLQFIVSATGLPNPSTFSVNIFYRIP